MEIPQTIDDILARTVINDRRETTASNSAFVEYCRMGTKRSLRALQERFEEQADAVTNGDGDKLPPTTKLKTIGEWSKDFNWVKRAEDYDQVIREERLKADEADRLEERQNRRAILKDMHKHVQDLMGSLDPSDIKQFRLMIAAVDSYMSQSRSEWNDLPGQNFDITTGGQPLKVNFVTEPISQSAVDERLKLLGLGHLVDEQTDYTDYDSDNGQDTSRLEIVTE